VLKISAPHLPDSGAVEFDTGIGKLQAFLDLRLQRDLDVLKNLIRTGDVFSQSYRPGTLAARGFSPQEAAKLRPGIVYVTLSAWGTEGPWQDRRGFDSIVQTVSGMAYAQAGERPPGRPRLMPVSANDYIAGYLMAFGAMAGLARRATEGGSWLVRVSLARTGKWIVDRGTVEGFASVPAELPGEELQELLVQTQRFTHLRPVLELSETPPYWERPPTPLGTHPAQWPDR
jgi:crotonobetainyl-CoA:carnitine CoA-transferase CaiB-like acyl-CoA transferase